MTHINVCTSEHNYLTCIATLFCSFVERREIIHTQFQVQSRYNLQDMKIPKNTPCGFFPITINFMYFNTMQKNCLTLWIQVPM